VGLAVIEPALIGDKSGSSPTDEKGTTSEEEQPEPVTEDESTAPATEDEDASDEPPGVGEEAKVCTTVFFSLLRAHVTSTAK
jgi:hypothetical protein